MSLNMCHRIFKFSIKLFDKNNFFEVTICMNTILKYLIETFYDPNKENQLIKSDAN